MAWLGFVPRRPQTTVVVIGPADRVLVEALWRAGLRPVRGARPGSTLWALPEGARR